MKVVILCGGMGTRLREETEYRPKPMVEIGDKPILWHIMKLYAHYGFNEFILCLGYRGNMIKDYFLNYESMVNDFTIVLGRRSGRVRYRQNHEEKDIMATLVDTGLSTLTGGRVKKIEPYLTDKTFMVTYGDGVSDVNIRELLRFHNSHGKIATVTAIRAASRFGVLQIQKDGTVRGLREKPQLNERINGGFFVFDRRVLDYLDADGALEERPLERLAEEGQLMAYNHDGFWYAMDTYRDFLYLNELWKNGNTPWAVWGKRAALIARRRGRR